MKALYIVSAFPRNPEDVITPWLTETILRLRRRGIDIEVLAPAYRGLQTQSVHGVRVHRFRYAPRPWETLTHDQTAPDRIRQRPITASLLPGYLIGGMQLSRKLVRSNEFDLVHAFWPLPHGLLGMAAKRAGRIPLVETFFGVELTWMESQLGFLKPLARRIVRGADGVTAISSHTASLLRRLVPGIEPTIIPFGAAIETDISAPSPDEPLHAGLKLLFVGRLVERKGVHILLDALALLPEEPPIDVEIVGDGPERAALEHRARSLGIQHRVRFHGFVPRDELELRLRSCDALVLPAITDAKGDVEGLGVVLLEAMNFARPVIASLSGGITDIVRPGENGLLVPPGDAAALASALEDFARDPRRVRQLGMAAHRDVRERFSWDSIIDRLEGVYTAVVAAGPT